MPSIEELKLQLTQYPWRAQQAALPFALVQAWNLPCAYERSVKLSHGKMLSNRFLIALSASQVTRAHVEMACQHMSLAVDVCRVIEKHWRRAAMFMLGFEETALGVVFKVYLELRRYRMELPCSHVGWKQLVREPQTDPDSQPSHGKLACRVAHYRPLRHKWLVARLAQLSHHDDDSEPSASVLREVLRASQSHLRQLICLQVSEASGRRSYDWNVYAANLRIADFAEPIVALADQYKIERSNIDRWLNLCGQSILGHIAAGQDDTGKDFLTLYYSSQSAD